MILKSLVMLMSMSVLMTAERAEARKDGRAAMHRKATRAYARKDWAGAAAAYERFLTILEEHGPGHGYTAWKRKKMAILRLKALRKGLASLDLECEVEGAVVRVDGRGRGKTPLPGKLYIKAGRRRLTVSKEGHDPWWRSLQLGKGEHRVVQVLLTLPKPFKAAAKTKLAPGDLKTVIPAPGRRIPLVATEIPTPEAEPARAGKKPFYKKWWFWTAVGAGVAVAGGVTAGVLATRAGPEPELGVITFR